MTGDWLPGTRERWRAVRRRPGDLRPRGARGQEGPPGRSVGPALCRGAAGPERLWCASRHRKRCPQRPGRETRARSVTGRRRRVTRVLQTPECLGETEPRVGMLAGPRGPGAQAWEEKGCLWSLWSRTLTPKTVSLLERSLKPSEG